MASPMVKDGGPAVREADDALDLGMVAVYMRCVGKLMYMSGSPQDILQNFTI